MYPLRICTAISTLSRYLTGTYQSYLELFRIQLDSVNSDSFLLYPSLHSCTSRYIVSLFISASPEVSSAYIDYRLQYYQRTIR